MGRRSGAAKTMEKQYGQTTTADFGPGKLEDIFINRQGAMLTDGAGKGRIWLMNSKIIKIIAN